MDYTVHGILQARIMEWIAFAFRGSSQPRDWTQISHIAGRFFTSWAIREAKNTEVGSLSLLQQIFLTQESTWGLLHCRQILYQLSYQDTIPDKRGFPGDSVVKNLPANAGDTGSIPGWGRFPGEGNGNPFQYSCLGSPMDRGAWWSTVHGGHKELDRTEQLSMHTSDKRSKKMSPVITR